MKFASLILILASSAIASAATVTVVETATAPGATTTVHVIESTQTVVNTFSSRPTQGISDDQFVHDVLFAHNQLRSKHGVPDLVWDQGLVDYATDYMNKALNCSNLQLVHSNGPYGENLAAGYGGGWSPVEAWYGEISLYDFSKPGFSSATGHFTQVVWKDSSKLGCARHQCNNEWGQYTICEYSDERGNIIGTKPNSGGLSFFQVNVLPPLEVISL